MISTLPAILSACNCSTNPSGYCGAVSSIRQSGKKIEENNKTDAIKSNPLENIEIFDFFILI